MDKGRGHENFLDTTITDNPNGLNSFKSKNEARQKVVIICMLTFGFIYVFHLIKESVIFLNEVFEEVPIDLLESDVLFLSNCWILYLFFLLAGLSILVYIWLKSHGTNCTGPPSKEE